MVINTKKTSPKNEYWSMSPIIYYGLIFVVLPCIGFLICWLKQSKIIDAKKLFSYKLFNTESNNNATNDEELA